MNLFVFTDGGSRGNPGPAAIGVYITDDKGKELASIGKVIGSTTNNVAEYKAILEALTWIAENKHKLGQDLEISFFMDSELAYRQIAGIYKIKNENLRELVYKIKEKEKEIASSISYAHVRREKNKNADKLVNLALDNKL
jgi:ribonuclease HI